MAIIAAGLRADAEIKGVQAGAPATAAHFIERAPDDDGRMRQAMSAPATALKQIVREYYLTPDVRGWWRKSGRNGLEKALQRRTQGIAVRYVDNALGELFRHLGEFLDDSPHSADMLLPSYGHMSCILVFMPWTHHLTILSSSLPPPYLPPLQGKGL